MEKYNCEYISEIICPYCGFDFQDSCEVVDTSEECHVVTCGDCDKDFNVTVERTITFSSTCSDENHSFVKGNDGWEECERCEEIQKIK